MFSHANITLQTSRKACCVARRLRAAEAMLEITDVTHIAALASAWAARRCRPDDAGPTMQARRCRPDDAGSTMQARRCREEAGFEPRVLRARRSCGDLSGLSEPPLAPHATCAVGHIVRGIEIPRLPTPSISPANAARVDRAGLGCREGSAGPTATWVQFPSKERGVEREQG